VLTFMTTKVVTISWMKNQALLGLGPICTGAAMCFLSGWTQIKPDLHRFIINSNNKKVYAFYYNKWHLLKYDP